VSTTERPGQGDLFAMSEVLIANTSATSSSSDEPGRIDTVAYSGTAEPAPKTPVIAEGSRPMVRSSRPACHHRALQLLTDDSAVELQPTGH
jgi:hypothetical protein